MKVVILAGGVGSRLSEETVTRPKPMVEIGGMPNLWHVMKIYGYHGFSDFIICRGYKGYLIKEFFANCFLPYLQNEREPMEALARSGELRAYVHRGFWHPMDTLRERNYLEEQWAGGEAPGRVW